MISYIKRIAPKSDKPDNTVYQVVATSPHGYYTVFYDKSKNIHGTKLIAHSEAVPYVGDSL